MAKTKRRQLAALAAQAGLKAAGYKDIIGCPSLSAFRKILQANPSVEVRTQRVIFKIPALPPKPADTATPEPTTKKGVLGKRRRRKPMIDVDLSSDLIPADEAKISKVMLNLRKWKRQKKVGAPPPAVGDTAATSGPSNRYRQSFVGKAKVSNRPSNGTLKPSVTKTSVSGRKSKASAKASTRPSNGTLKHSVPEAPVSGRKSKASVSLAGGTKKRVKVQQAPGISPAEEGDALEVEENMAGEKKINSLKNMQRIRKVVTKRRNDGAVDCLVPSDNSSRDILRSATNRSQESARTCNGYLGCTVEHSQMSRKRRNRSRKVKAQVPVSSKAAVASHQDTSTELGFSISEADAIEVFQKMRHAKTITQQRESFGKTLRDDRQLVRSVTDAAALNTHTQPQHLGTRHHSRSHVEQTERSAQWGPYFTPHSWRQNGRRTFYQTCSQSDSQPVLKPIEEFQIPSPGHGNKGLFLLTANLKDHLGASPSALFSRQKETVLWGADLLKQENKLSIMQKRLEAAGGLRKWLLDKGLGQFVPILEKRKIDNLSLLQLTMDSLKSMGLLPVGPRRKLIHAISSLTQPSIYKSSLIMPSG